MNLEEFLASLPRDPSRISNIEVLYWFEKIVEYEALASRVPAAEVSNITLESLRSLQTAYKRVLNELCR